MSCCCPVDISVVSRHLGILRDAGILEARKRGREVYYRVRIDQLTALLRNLADALEAWTFHNLPPSDPFSGLQDDDYVRIEMAYYF